jgi:uncharacterized protein (TIGR04222 family)
MLSMIRQVPGPEFLLLYALIIAAGIVIGRKWVAADGSEGHSLPDFTRFDPLSLALLRGGVNEVIRTAVFDLWKKDLLEILQERKKTTLRAKDGDLSALHPIETAIHHAVRGGTTNPSELFKSSELKQPLENQLARSQEDLTLANLLRNREAVGQAKRKKTTTIIIVLALGLAKLSLGLLHDRPVLFLVILLLFAMVTLQRLLPAGPLSTLGKRYLEGLQSHFGWIKSELAHGNQPAGVDPALVVAIFGVASLASIAQYQAFAGAFPARSQGITGDSSGCGGSAGGGSDGGGSDGGGGCGGCGGD